MLKAGMGGAAASVLLAACGAPSTSTSPAATTAPAAPKPTTAAAAPTTAQAAAPAAAGLTNEQISLLFMGHVAGGQNEQKAYDDILAEWQQQHPNIKVEYQVVPDAERITKAQAMVAADQAPDMWRHNADVIRLWAARGQLLDLTDLLPKDYGQSFLPGLRAYCIYKNRMWGLPHTTDTSALFYREDALSGIGVTPPKDIASAWTWQQFGDINDKLVAAKKQQYAFTHNQGGGRWVPSFLYSAGGKVVTDDFKNGHQYPRKHQRFHLPQTVDGQEVGTAGNLDNPGAERRYRPIRARYGVDGHPGSMEHHLPRRKHQR